MNFPYKINFNQLEWETPIPGVRDKIIDHGGQRVRLVEYSNKMPPHWCEKGHCGYLISGKMEIEFLDAKIIYNPGDGIIIPDGPDYKHKAKVLSEKALVFFIEPGCRRLDDGPGRPYRHYPNYDEGVSNGLS